MVFSSGQSGYFSSIQVPEAGDLRNVELKYDSLHLISFLVSKFPEGARISDSYHRLPLHRALDSQHFNFKIIRKLVDVFPNSVTMRDGATKLFPFMQAAVSNLPKSNETDKKNKNNSEGLAKVDIENCRLNIIFELLRLNPDVLCLHSNVSIDVGRERKKRRLA